MIRTIVLSELLEKNIQRNKIPVFVIEKLIAWMHSVSEIGLEETRKRPGYHDEPLRGRLEGLRSVRLSKAWRAYYVIEISEIRFVKIERVDKHDY